MSSNDSATSPRVVFGGVNPIFRVHDLASSLDYYVNKLGFKIDWSVENLNFACVSRDRCGIFLSEGDQGNPGVWVWIGVDDVSRLYEEYRRNGAKIRNEPVNFSWAYEMQVEDLDGNVLRIGSDPLPDQPFGPWRDMHGDLWVATPDGGWTKA